MLFKTPKAVCAVRKKGQTPKVVKTGEDVSPSERKISLGLTGIKRLMKTPRRSAEVCLDGLSNLMKTPNEKGSEKASETPSYEGLKRMFSTPKERCSRSDKHPSDSTLYGVSRLMKSPKIRENAEENYEGVPELFEVLEMSSPIKVTRTPSLRRCSTAVEEVKVVSPLEAKPTPSLKKAAETVTVMSPLVEAKTPSIRITAAETQVEWPEQETAYGDSEVAVIKRSTEATSVVTFGGRVTRSKRKLEVNTIPVAKKPCRNRDPRSSSEKRTGEKTEPPTRQSSVLPGAQVGVGDEDMVETFLSRPTTRARRHRNVAEQKNEIEVKSRGKRAAPSEFTEPNVKIQKVMKQFVTMEKSRSRHGDLDNSTQPKQSDVVGAWNKRSTRSSRTNPTNTTPKEGTKLSKSANKAVPSTPKTTSCGSRMSKNVAGIPETPQPLVITKTKLEPITEVPTPASSSRESTVTPSLQFARVELRSRDKRSQESSKIAHTTLKQDITIQATENQRTTRGKRQISSVVQQSVKETKTTIRQRKNVRVDESTNGKQVERITVTAVSSRTRGKLNNEAKNEEQESDHVCNKRSTRRTKITASVEEANVDESSSKRPGGRLTRVSKNDKITNEKTVEEKADGSGQKRLTRARKVSVQLVQEQSSGASCEGKRTSRSRRGTKPVEREEDVKEKENIPDLKKRPRRGDVLSKDENRKSKNDSKSSGESKRTTRSAVKEKLGKKEATSETMNSRTSEGEEKVLVSPAGRVTRSRHSTKKT